VGEPLAILDGDGGDRAGSCRDYNGCGAEDLSCRTT
jgi:hypothetical protein